MQVYRIWIFLGILDPIFFEYSAKKKKIYQTLRKYFSLALLINEKIQNNSG